MSRSSDRRRNLLRQDRQLKGAVRCDGQVHFRRSRVQNRASQGQLGARRWCTPRSGESTSAKRIECLPAPGPHHDVSADGQRFLMIKPGADSHSLAQIVVVQNWSEELNRLVPIRQPGR